MFTPVNCGQLLSECSVGGAVGEGSAGLPSFLGGGGLLPRGVPFRSRLSPRLSQGVGVRPRRGPRKPRAARARACPGSRAARRREPGLPPKTWGAG